MHTVRLLLKTTAYDEQVMEKRFRAAAHIHNVLVKHAKKLLKKLEHDAEYRLCLSEYVELSRKESPTKAEKTYRKILSDRMAQIRLFYGLSEYGFQSYIKVCAKQFRKCLSSQQVQKEATRVWRGVEKVLFSNGKDIHYKKAGDFCTIGGKTNTNGVKFHKDTFSVEWIGLSVACRMPKDRTGYLMEALDHDISYCEVGRMMFPGGWHYYVVVYLKGDAPRKLISTGSPDNITGIDMGTSTMAAVSENSVYLKELAPKCRVYNKRIEKILRHMDASRRASNPDKYNPDGTINRADCSKWVYTQTYLKNLRKLKSLYRQKAAYIKQSHEEQINRLLEDSVNFIVEDMSFKGLQRRARNTERSDRISNIPQKDGSVKLVRKYKRKKRFGKSLNNRAPASFLTILERKANLYGGTLAKVNTKEFKASRYDHVEDTYKETHLRERDKIIGGSYVQRDLYSAFLIRNSNSTLTKPDREKCIYEFGKFLRMQNNLITAMKADNISMKQCFGF